MRRFSIRGVFYPSRGEHPADADPPPTRARLLLGSSRFGRDAEILLLDERGSSIEREGDFYPDAPPGPPMRP